MRFNWWRHPALGPDDIEVVNVRRQPLGDLYHLLLRAPWSLVLGGVGALFVLMNLLFAVAYLIVGGVSGVRPGSLADAFYFSVQTMGTIGYGVMYPSSTAAHLLVTGEMLVGISLVALTTGLLFSKFSVPRARMQFARYAVIAPFNGTPTLMLRLGNERASQIIEATVRVVLMRTERTAEGHTFYRMYDLHLERERSPALARSWTVLHRVLAPSPLHEATPATLLRDEVELVVTVVGLDETSAQNLHGRYRYLTDQIRWGVRHADLLSERGDGGLRLDMSKFHDVVPTEPTAEFPYP